MKKPGCPLVRLRGFTLVEVLATVAVMAILFGFAGPFFYQLQQHTLSAETKGAQDRFVAQASTMFRNSVRPTDAASWQVSASKLMLGDRECRVDPNGLHFGLGKESFQPLVIPAGLDCVFSQEAGAGDNSAPRLVLTIHEGARLRARIVACGNGATE